MRNIKRFHPGVYISDALETMGMTNKEFALRTGISERTLSPVINGKGSVTFDIAEKLASFFGNTVSFWCKLQTQYDEYLSTEERNKLMDDDWKLLKPFKSYFMKWGVVQKEDDNLTMVSKVRNISKVNILSNLTKKDSLVCFKELHSQKDADSFSQNLWMALALNRAREQEKCVYNRDKLLNSLDEIRSLTVLDPSVFYPRLVEILKTCGVSFVLVPYLTKSNIYGATKWLSNDNVMVAISNRGEKADSFWFTLFHELSHVLMEHKRNALYNVDGHEDKDADQFASDKLIPQKDWEEFTESFNGEKQSIETFAKKEGILPCIIVGRLHKEKIVDYSRFYKDYCLSYIIRG